MSVFLEIAQESINRFTTMQHADEFARMLEVIAAIKPKKILEIGSYKGGSLWAYNQVAPQAELYSIDLGILDDNLAAKWPVDANLLNADSTLEETFHQALQEIGEVDFLFIDGNHEYWAAAKDYFYYSQLVREGGVVGLHDIHPHIYRELHNVQDLWIEILQSTQWKTEQILYHHGEWGGIGLEFVGTPR
jgi:predicted O-methyltransferase YrrM